MSWQKLVSIEQIVFKGQLAKVKATMHCEGRIYKAKTFRVGHALLLSPWLTIVLRRMSFVFFF